MTITNHGSIDHFITGTTGERLLDCFVAIKKAMDHLCTVGGGSLFEAVASNYGLQTSGSLATGFGYHDEANPCGDNAFIVYRSLVHADYYVMFQIQRGTDYGQSTMATQGTRRK